MIVTIYSVFCDADAAGRRSDDCNGWAAQEQSIAKARQEARKAGWKRLPGLLPRGIADICPPCARHIQRSPNA